MATSGIKSIQRGTIAITAGNTTQDATVTAVVTAKSHLSYLGNSRDGDLTHEAYLQLVNSTTVRATRNGSSGTTNVNYELVEHN